MRKFMYKERALVIVSMPLVAFVSAPSTHSHTQNTTKDGFMSQEMYFMFA